MWIWFSKYAVGAADLACERHDSRRAPRRFRASGFSQISPRAARAVAYRVRDLLHHFDAAELGLKIATASVTQIELLGEPPMTRPDELTPWPCGR